MQQFMRYYETAFNECLTRIDWLRLRMDLDLHPFTLFSFPFLY